MEYVNILIYIELTLFKYNGEIPIRRGILVGNHLAKSWNNLFDPDFKCPNLHQL